MKRVFKIENVKCGGCANTLIKALSEEFGNVSVNLDVMPREITLDIEDEQIEALKMKLRSLGYPFSDEQLTTFQNINAKAKSFVSCAIGKMD